MSALPEPRFLHSASPPHIATLIVLSGLGALSMNIFLPSLPGMAAHFGTEYRLMQLSVALYLAMSGVLQILIGPVSDRFGRRPVVLWALALFMLATTGCLLAPTAEVFLLCRMFQAVVVAGLVISRAAIRDMVPAEEAASMIGYVTMGMSLVPMIGPAIGGVLDELFAWQANFVLLLGLGAAAFWLAWRDMGETAVHRASSLGAQLRAYPRLLRSPRFWGYALAAAFASGSFFSYLGGAPFVGSVIYGMDQSTLGFYFGAPALGYLLGNWISGRFSTRVGVNRMILAGTLVPTAGLATALALFGHGETGPGVFFGVMTLVGLGNGMTLPNANAGMLSVRPELAGSASGLGGALMIGGGAALSAWAGTLLSPETGAMPLIELMLACAILSIVSILVVIWRARMLALRG